MALMTQDTVTAGGVRVERIENEVLLQAAYDVRLEVFVHEQQVPPDEEIDALDTDPTTTHVLALDVATGKALGTARLLPNAERPGHFHIGRVAVRKEARGRQIGAALMRALEDIAAQETDGPAEIELSAQIQASGFYRTLGYEQSGDHEYLDAGIRHIDMKKKLAPQPR
jgi:predicted GNAT family N-acyltransferase